MEGTVFTASLEGIKHVKSENGVILTKPFLEVCKHILPVLGTWLTLLIFSSLRRKFQWSSLLSAMP
ncbi:hypothetical protein GW17_00003293 [Ensete ventricosum]|uniref:Uncharacterized protein n=1 Tax=Ensete ventricosum TaxID=4639 RepID=A0A427A6E9_ENSVE|nr:hypothetical protein B296_00002192 [Ensete ventricosum]RWW32048.1 hypothetical protein GW17_00003293 [Ensete ventricosum]RZR85177.1 hypothetical protein BHM03_00012122 [Ensete ventricosum]